MTLIIGIKCSNGIVMGADGAATLGAMGQTTIRQPVRKLQIIDDTVVVGVSGPVGLSQQYTGSIEDLWRKKGLSGKPVHEAGRIIQNALWPACQQAMNAAKIASGAYGSVAFQSSVAVTMVGAPIDKALRLFQFDQQCSPEEATEDLPFVAIGSGQQIADPFLAFLRRVFWPAALPTLLEGVFATVWTLQHAIDTNPGGVADPKQIVTISKTKSSYEAHELVAEDFEEHFESIKAAESALRGFRTSLGANRSDLPEPPTP